MNKYSIVFIFASLLMVACEKVVDIDVPDVDNKPVLNAMFKAEDSLLVVELSNSAKILESLPDADSTAVVEVWINDALAYSLPYNNFRSIYDYKVVNNNRVYYLRVAAFSKQLPAALGNYGSKIEIKARVGGELVTASQVMPQMPPDFSATFVEDAISVSGGGIENFKFDGFRLRFQDGAGEDYYAVSATSSYYWFNGQDTIVNSGNNVPLSGGTNLVLSDYNGQVLLKDNTFNGREANLLMGSHNIHRPSESEHYEIVLERITKEKYLYLTSLARYENSYGNPFAEPSLVYNNSSSGFGIFGLSSRRVKMLGE